MNQDEKAKKLAALQKLLALVLWAAVIVFCWTHRSIFSADGISQAAPENPFLAAMFLLVLFAVKSLSFVLYAGILYAASGILFPVPWSILLNILGSIIVVTIPYWLGRKGGRDAAERIRRKYPRAEAIHQLRAKNDFLFAFLARMLRLPSDVASMYMGAVEVSFWPYFLGSLLAVLPHTITYPMIGRNIGNVHSPAFRISLCAEIVYVLATMAVYALYKKNHKNN